MGTNGLRLSGDLNSFLVALVFLLVGVTVWLLVRESRRADRARLAIVFSGSLAAFGLALAVLRPVALDEVRDPSIARVSVIVDASERLRLPGLSGERRADVVARVLRDLEATLQGARIQTFGFSDGKELWPYKADDRGPPRVHSDFERAISAVESDANGLPAAVVVLSDGQRTTPADEKQRTVPPGGVVHTVRLLDSPLPDRSLLRVSMPDSVVAHEPFRVDVELGCSGGVSCEKVELRVFELLQGGQREERGRAVPEVSVTPRGAIARASLRVTLDRAGARVLEFEAEGDAKDVVPENNRRFLEVNVRRDRLRLLHVAGRPTYDVRALRTFLKSDRSLDLVAFFILRTTTDHVMASQSELALIPFPVDELFTEHLPSFDAVILQDIDAVEYGVAAHFRSLRDYVKKGGGLAMIGGPSMFGAGGYADSPLAEISPVALVPTNKVADMAKFVPGYTRLGREAPLLSGLRALLDEQLPEVSGTNLVGPAEARAYVLWEHPDLPPLGGASGDRMPILAVREVGDGRTLALTIDSTHKLRFGPEGLKSAGRAHGALWEGMLGWLMRDARFELARAKAPWPCISGRPYRIEVEAVGDAAGSVDLQIEALGQVPQQKPIQVTPRGGGEGLPAFELEGPPPGGYAALIQMGKGPPLRFVFACEAGGEAWADTRPDPERLTEWSAARGGLSVSPSEVGQIPVPSGSQVITRSVSSPLFPDAVWSTLAAVLLGIHWLVRRFGGLL
jgi:uncharacterized membrane protein